MILLIWNKIFLIFLQSILDNVQLLTAGIFSDRYLLLSVGKTLWYKNILYSIVVYCDVTSLYV